MIEVVLNQLHTAVDQRASVDDLGGGNQKLASILLLARQLTNGGDLAKSAAANEHDQNHGRLLIARLFIST